MLWQNHVEITFEKTGALAPHDCPGLPYGQSPDARVHERGGACGDAAHAQGGILQQIQRPFMEEAESSGHMLRLHEIQGQLAECDP